MRGSGSTAQFNHYLLELMHIIIPRKIEGREDLGVKRLLAESSKDYADILVREAELRILWRTDWHHNWQYGNRKNMLERMGLEINEATHDQETRGSSADESFLKARLEGILAVTNHRTQKQFDQYLDGYRDHFGEYIEGTSVLAWKPER